MESRNRTQSTYSNSTFSVSLIIDPIDMFMKSTDGNCLLGPCIKEVSNVQLLVTRLYSFFVFQVVNNYISLEIRNLIKN